MSDVPDDKLPSHHQLVVVVKSNGHLVMEVNPRTRKVTTNPQQFLTTPDERGYSLQILPKERWIENPAVVEVDSFRVR